MNLLKIITKPNADKDYLKNAIHYIVFGHSDMVGGFNICPECALEQMQIVKKYYGKTEGNQLVHFVISFDRNVYTAAYADKLARKIAKYYADWYQLVYAVHTKERTNDDGYEKNIFHVHMVMNSVSFMDGSEYPDDAEEAKKFAKHIAEVTGISRWKLEFASGT